MSKVTHLTLDESGGVNRQRIHLREISDATQAPLETVGQDLRAARLRRGDDLSTIARALKIRKDHLEALEEDRFEVLPGRTYAIGFIRSYANYLGLNAADVIARFKSQTAGLDQGTKVPVLEREPQDERRMPKGWQIIAVVLVLFAAFIAWRLIRSANAPVEAPVAPVPAAMAPAAPVKQALRVVPPPAKPEASLPAAPAAEATPPGSGAGATASVAAAPAVVPGTAPSSPGGTTAPAAGAPASNPPVTAAATTTPTPTPSAPVVPSLADQVKALPEGHVYGERNKAARIVLRALKPVRILVQGPPPKQITYMNRLLQPGDVYRVPDIVGTTLSTRDPDGLAVELDGQLMGLAGQSGHMAEGQPLDPQALADHVGRPSEHQAPAAGAPHDR